MENLVLPRIAGSSMGVDLLLWVRARRLFENGYFSQSLRQTQIIILEILQCISVVIIFAFLDLGKNISFSDTLQVIRVCGANSLF